MFEPAFAVECHEPDLRKMLSDLEQSESVIYESALGQRERATLALLRRTAGCYRGMIDESGQSTLPDEMLAFRILDLAVEISKSGALHAAFERSYRALAASGLATESVKNRYYYGLVSLKHFGKASAFAKRERLQVRALPDGGVLPISSDRIGRGILIADKRAWRPESLSANPAPQLRLIVLAHPTCKFSRAAAAVFADQRRSLEQTFDDIRWLSGPGNETYFPQVVAWNEEFPDSQLAMMESSESWGEFNDAAVPAFYLLRGEEILSVIEGWPDSATLENVLDAGRAVQENCTVRQAAPGECGRSADAR